jgi:hypothetical protein
VRPGPVVSPYVQYLLVAPARHLVWWLAVRDADGSAVGGLRLNLHTGRTGRDVVGESVVDNSAAIALYDKLGYTVALRSGTPITFRGGNGRRCQVMFKRVGM